MKAYKKPFTNNAGDVDDEDFVYKALYEEYWYLMQMACIFPDMRKSHCLLSLVYFAFMAFILVYMILICLMTAIKMPEDFLVASQALHFCTIQVACFFVVFSTNMWRNNYRNIHTIIGIGPVEYDEVIKAGTKKVKDELNVKKKSLTTAIITYLTFVGFLTAVLAPFVDSMLIGSEQSIYSPGGVSLNLPLKLWTPFGSHTSFTYTVSIVMQMLGAFEITTVVVASDVTLIVMTQYLTMEMSLLTVALQNMPERAKRLYISRCSVNDNKNVHMKDLRNNAKLLHCYQLCLEESAAHYQKIIKGFAQVNRIISIPSFMAYFCGSIVIALSGIILILGSGGITSLITVVLLGIGEILNMFLISWCGNELDEANDKIIKALYSTKWYLARKEAAKTLQIMLCRAQRRLTLLAGGYIPLNFETFTNVMNSSYSYFNLIYASKTG